MTTIILPNGTQFETQKPQFKSLTDNVGSGGEMGGLWGTTTTGDIFSNWLNNWKAQTTNNYYNTTGTSSNNMAIIIVVVAIALLFGVGFLVKKA